MDNFSTWLTLSGLGILFGLFPGYTSTAGILYEAILVQKKKPVKLMCEAFFIDLERPEVTLWARGPRRTRRVSWYISTAYIVVLLIVGHYFAWVGVDRETDLLTILAEETSFPIFLLLTWLLPVYFMRRYLKKLKSGRDIDYYTYHD